MAEVELSSSKKTSPFGIGQAFIIAQSIIAILLIAAAVAVILLWLISLVLSLTPNSGLMPWVASGVSAFGLLFIFLASIPGFPGIIWATWLINGATPRWTRILKITVWIGKVTFKVGAIAAILILVLAIVAGFGGARKPDSIKTVAAFEVPLQTEADHDEFLLVLGAAATAEGMHVYSDNKRVLEMESKNNPNFQMTVNTAVWRGPNNHELVANAMDQVDHLGQIWLMFSRGEEPEVNAKFRERVMHEIMQHWPGTLSLPITPSGGIPLRTDLIQTPAGYVVKPSEAKRYGLPSTETPLH